MSPRRHIVITGTGRAGTTFLVELLTHLGLETGFSIDQIPTLKDKIGRAGLESDIRNQNSPFIVKSPWFCDYADQVIYRKDIVIEHIFIPVRDLHAAAESRRHVTISGSPNGGLWHTDSHNQGDQERILLMQLYKLMHAVSDTEIPVTLLRYPRITRDDTYLFNKLYPIVSDIEFNYFQRVFTCVVRSEHVHRFNENDC
jgi:hypothetical protein